MPGSRSSNKKRPPTRGRRRRAEERIVLGLSFLRQAALLLAALALAVLGVVVQSLAPALWSSLVQGTVRWLGLAWVVLGPLAAVLASIAILRPRLLLRPSWRAWLVGLIIIAAAMGVASYLRPQGVEIGGVALQTTSLGGSLGQAITGGGGGGGAVLVTFLLGVALVLVFPRQTLALGGIIAGMLAHLARPRSKPRPAPRWEQRTWDEQATPAIVLQEEATPISAPPPPPQPPPEEVREATEEEPTPSPEKLPAPASHWQLPPLEIFARSPEGELSAADNAERAHLIEEALISYGVDAKVVQISPGPAVTQFGVEPGWDRKLREVKERDVNGRIKLDKDGRPKTRREEVGRTRVKVERITSLANDLALALAVSSIRIEAPVPGQSVVGIEVPNTVAGTVNLRSIIESTPFQRTRARSKLALALGKGVAGEPVAGDLSKMPHLLIAGATGSGKSVCINSIIACLLMHNTPEEVRLLLIDPKRVELTAWGSIPHLLSPVVVDMERVVASLRWAAREMEQRYRQLASVSARNIEAYNKSPRVEKPLPYIVIIIDELADVMMVAPYEVERTLCRLAQLARATGIHLVVATQRPSVDVITGLIKANFPTRISFAVTSQVDSRTILDGAGAEKLLGRGDMLYMPQDAPKPKRVQGAYISDQEIERLVVYWNDETWRQLRPPQYADDIEKALQAGETGVDEDPLLERARQLAGQYSRLSVSLLQRRLHIGYNRAARMLELLEGEGIVTPGEPGKSRQVIGAAPHEQD